MWSQVIACFTLSEKRGYDGTLKCDLKEHNQLLDRADLGTSFLTLKKVHLNLKSKTSGNPFQSSKCSACFSTRRLLKKTVFECAFAYPMIFFILVNTTRTLIG